MFDKELSQAHTYHPSYLEAEAEKSQAEDQPRNLERICLTNKIEASRCIAQRKGACLACTGLEPSWNRQKDDTARFPGPYSFFPKSTDSRRKQRPVHE